MPKNLHPHKYVKAIVGKGRVVYKCVIPSCTHYQTPSLVLDRECTCNDCDAIFIPLTRRDLLNRLLCRNCRKKIDVEPDRVLEVLEKLIEAGANRE